jgi:glyoxylase-like metal-dependent hydrolase (beta-lactamase superfamily II)
MSNQIYPITLPMPFRMGSVNCYLVEAQGGFLLIDSGSPNSRQALDAELQGLGCRPGALRLCIMTHGDFDHIGNAAHVRATFGSKLAMHAGDAPMAEVGDMFAGREKSNFLLKALVPRLIGFGKSERFVPDILLEDGSGLSEYGLEAQVISIPGHSSGSIGVLTADGDFFCGDLLENTKAPALGSIVDDRAKLVRSAEMLKSLHISMVYPGHGRPFSFDELSLTAT